LFIGDRLFYLLDLLRSPYSLLNKLLWLFFYLSNKLNFFKQYFTLSEGLFDLFLILFFRNFLLWRNFAYLNLPFIFLFSRETYTLCFIQEGKRFFCSEWFLRFSLYLLNIGTIEFTLMLFEVHIEAALSIKVLIADVAFNKTSNRRRFLNLYLFYLFLSQAFHAIFKYHLKDKSKNIFKIN